MNIRTIASTAVIALTCLASGPASGAQSADQLINAGWDCFPAGPNDWIHCMDLDKLINGNPSVPVKVFSVDGSEYLGTELLLHEDVYAGQPCPQDDLNLWEPQAGIPFMACHHFLTGHH